MRAQVSVEYLLITGFSLLLLAPLLVLFADQQASVNDQFQQSQAQLAADTIIQSATRVYYSGPPSKETFNVRIPQGVESFVVEEQVIVLRLDKNPPNEIVAISATPLIPDVLNEGAGIATITVQATDTGVLITNE